MDVHVALYARVQLLNKKERRHLKRKAEAEARERESGGGGAKKKK